MSGGDELARCRVERDHAYESARGWRDIAESRGALLDEVNAAARALLEAMAAGSVPIGDRPGLRRAVARLQRVLDG